MVPNGAKFIERGGKTRGCPPDSHFSGTWRILPPLLAFLRFSGPDFHPSEQQLALISWFPPQIVTFFAYFDRSVLSPKREFRKWHQKVCLNADHLCMFANKNQEIAPSRFPHFICRILRILKTDFCQTCRNRIWTMFSKQKWSNESWNQ